MPTHVDIGKVKAGNNPRRRLGDLKALTASIREIGIVQPLVVVANGDGWQVVAGHRRLAAAKKAGLRTVPITVRDDRTAEAALVENLHREDLTPMEEAQAMFDLTELGVTQATVGKLTGRSKSQVSDRVKLMNLPKAAQKALHEGQMTLTVAEGIASIDDPKLLAEVKQLAKDRTDFRDPWGSAYGETLMQAERDAEGEAARNLAVEITAGGGELLNNGDLCHLTPGWDDDPDRVVVPRSWIMLDKVGLEAQAHRVEECHAVAVIWQHYRVGVAEFCKKAARHKTTGKSEMKIPGTEEIEASQAEERAARKALREAAAQRWATYQSWKPGAGLVDLFAEALILSAHHQAKTTVAKRLGLEPVKVNGRNEWAVTFGRWAEEVGPKQAAWSLLLFTVDPLEPEGWHAYRGLPLRDHLTSRGLL